MLAQRAQHFRYRFLNRTRRPARMWGGATNAVEIVARAAFLLLPRRRSSHPVFLRQSKITFFPTRREKKSIARAAKPGAVRDFFTVRFCRASSNCGGDREYGDMFRAVRKTTTTTTTTTASASASASAAEADVNNRDWNDDNNDDDDNDEEKIIAACRCRLSWYPRRHKWASSSNRVFTR